MNKELLLLSGGLDSVALAYSMRPDVALNIDYGQRPAGAEQRASQAVCNELGVPYSHIQADVSFLGSGDMVNRPPHHDAPVSEWWPFRNQFLITLAGMKALQSDCTVILIGCVASDNAHADGTENFVSGLSRLLSLQEGRIVLRAPAIAMSSTELISQSQIPFSTLAWSHSCHTSNFACGTCRGCIKHYDVMRSLGHDPF